MYTVIMVYPGHKLEIPASSLSTAKTLMLTELSNSDANLVRIRILQGPNVVMMVNARAKEVA